MPVQQVMPVTCPNCRTQFNAPIEPIIDGQDLEKKHAFLQGYLNVIRCPKCGFAGMAAVPVFYYDLEKELAFVFVPNDMNMLGEAQEKIIGDLTNRLINNLPTEQRKFYLFNPKTFLSLDSMVKAILEADGITEDMLEAQEERVKLIQELLETSNETQLKQKVKENDARFDREFFETLTALMQTAQVSGDQERAQTFLALRSLVSRWSTNGRKLVAEIDRELGLVVMQSQEELLESLQKAKADQEFEALVAAGHPFLDYGFFQQLTAKIDQAVKDGNQEEAETLRNLRTRVLDTKARLEAQNKAALEKAGSLLQEVLQSSQPEKVIEKKLDQLDEAFFFLLQANAEEARRQGKNEAAQAMEMIAAVALTKLREKYGPAEEETPVAVEEKPTIHIASR